MVPVDDPGYIYLTRKPVVVRRAGGTEPERNVGCGPEGQVLLKDKSTSIQSREKRLGKKKKISQIAMKSLTGLLVHSLRREWLRDKTRTQAPKN